MNAQIIMSLLPHQLRCNLVAIFFLQSLFLCFCLLVYGAVHLYHQGGNIVSFFFFFTPLNINLNISVQNVSCCNCVPDVTLIQLYVGISIY